MDGHILTFYAIQTYADKLFEDEKSKATIDKYVRDISFFYRYLPENKRVDKACVIRYKLWLEERYKASSINSMLIALNGFFTFLSWNECRVKLMKVQKSAFRSASEGMHLEEYKKLVEAASFSGKERLAVMIQAMCATGIRVSELKYLTVESLAEGKAVINNKGKVRVILIPREVQKLLQDYCAKRQIRKGMIFTTRSGKPVDRSNIWREMKKLSESAKVEQKKIYPHNLRHLFAVTYYKREKNIIYLSDVLGHSSVESTRIYTSINEEELHERISGMGLVVGEK